MIFIGTKCVNTWRLKLKGLHFIDILKLIFLYASWCISIQISLKFVYKDPNNNTLKLVQIIVNAEQVTSHCLKQWWPNLRMHSCVTRLCWVNTLRQRQNGCRFRRRHFSNTFYWMKMYEFQLKFHWSLFLRVQLTIFPALVQIMAWHQPGDKPLSEPMLVSLPMHICVNRPQWLNCSCSFHFHWNCYVAQLWNDMFEKHCGFHWFAFLA